MSLKEMTDEHWRQDMERQSKIRNAVEELTELATDSLFTRSQFVDITNTIEHLRNANDRIVRRWD